MKFPSPTITPPTLVTWQFETNGYRFGYYTDSGVLGLTGLGDNPEIRSNNPKRARDHGELVGLDLYGGRTFTITLLSRPDTESVQHNLLALAGALKVGLQTEQPFWFKQPNLPLLCVMCRCEKKSVPWDVNYAASMWAKPVAQFHATDPRVYGVTKTKTVGLPTPTSGLKFPVTFPVTFGSVSPSGVTCTNTGNTTMRPVLVITGPVTNPSMVNASITGNPTLTISNPTQSGYTVATGDQMVIDLDAQSVEYYVGGVSKGSPASRMSWVVSGSTWWDFGVGANLVQFLSSDSGDVTGTLTVQWAPAFIL